MGDIQKLVVFLSTSIFFLGLVYLFTSGPSLTGAGVADVPADVSAAGDSAPFFTSSPLILFVVLGIAIYTILTIIRKHD